MSVAKPKQGNEIKVEVKGIVIKSSSQHPTIRVIKVTAHTKWNVYMYII